MLISIIVPVYKVEIYLHRCINSILTQTYQNWELILVDDGSPDSSPAICDEYASRDRRIKVIHKKNGGQAEARNRGLDIATGDYIMFVDSDDYVHPNMLKTMLDVALHEGADIVQCNYLQGDADIFPQISERKTLHTFDNHSIFSSTKQKIILWAKLYKNSLWDDIRIPVGTYYEDDASTWQLYYKSSKIVVLDISYYYYYANPSGTMAMHRKNTSLDFIKIYKDRISFFIKQNEGLLVSLSKWRFCLPLMLVYMRGNITTEEKNLLLCLYKENVGTVVACKKVPFKYRFLLRIFNIWPQVFRLMFILLGRAHTIK